MKVPTKVPMNNTLHGSGLNGLARYQYRNEGFGVQLDALRARSGAAWVEVWTADGLPDREFKNYEELRLSLMKLKKLPPPYRAVSLGWSKPLAGSHGRCDLCRGRLSWNVRMRYGWRPTDESFSSSCDECLPKVKADPGAAIEARRKWVREHPIDFGKPKTPVTSDGDRLDDDIPF